MNNTRTEITCTQFQDMIPDLAGTQDADSIRFHLETCSHCRALVSDLESITQAARQLLPIVEPPDALWEQIDSAIRNPKNRHD
jgi:hypothetical protein